MPPSTQAVSILRTVSSRAIKPSQPLRVTTSSPRQQIRRSIHTSLQSSSNSIYYRTRRPTAHCLSRTGVVPNNARLGGRRTLFIQTENTPNADALKFIPNSRVLPEGFNAPFIEYLNARSTVAPPHPSTLASQIIEIDGVMSVFYGTDYITVTKDNGSNWAHLKPEIFSLITEAVTAGTPLVTTIEGKGEEGQSEAEQDSLAFDENDSEVVSMIKELLETRIRPAIQEDGGDIEFKGFEDGWVSLKLRGACRTCDSSTVTLRNGIESMLMHYIEEVKGVQQVLDEEEKVALKEFAKFEEALKAKKGDAATASTGGKGTLDHAA